LSLYKVALEEGRGRLALFTLPEALTFVSADINKIADYAVNQSRAGKEVYLHIHLHDLPEGEIPRRGSLDTVSTAIGVFSDIDCVGPGRKKPANTLCGSVNDATWVLDRFTELYKPLHSSLVVRSGYGLYAGLLFREPLIINGPNDRKRLQDLSRRVHGALHGIACGQGWTGAVDFCDPAKVLRFPGVVNWKDPAHPRPVTLVWEAPVRFDPTDLEEVLPCVDGREAATDGAAGEYVLPDIGEIVIDTTVEIPPMFLEALRATHAKLGPTWDNTRMDLKDQSCSGYDLALAAIAVECGLTDQQIADILVAHRNKFRGAKQDRRGHHYVKYLRATIVKARSGKKSSVSAEQEWATLEEQLGSTEEHQADIQTDLVEADQNTSTAQAQRHTPFEDLALNPEDPPPFEKFESLCGTDRKLRHTWDHRRPDLPDQSQATYDQELANIAAKANWTDTEIASLIGANRRKHGVDSKMGQEYYADTIARARKVAEPSVLDQQLAGFLNAAPDQGARDSGSTAAARDPKDGAMAPGDSTAPMRRAAILRVLSARFKVPLKRIVRFTGEPALYRLETELGDVQLGGVAGLINQSKLRISIADATGRYLPQIDPDVWPSTAQCLLDACESVDRGQDATLRGTMSEWLRAYLTEKSIHATLEEADEGREPFLDNGTVVIFAADLKRWLQLRQNERVAQGRLTADLRAFGAEPDVFKAVIGGRPTTRSAWRLPQGPWIPIAA
jgi:hypothetical protein